MQHAIEGKKKVAAIVRSFNNPAIAEQVDRLLETGVGRVIVVINADREPDRKTLDFLGRERLNNPRVIVHEMDSYGWSQGINRGLFLADNYDRKLKPSDDPGSEYILNISNEAILGTGQLDAMLEAITRDPEMGMVGTTFQGMKKDEEGRVQEVNLGPTYNRFPRNTCALYRFGALKDTWGFDPAPEQYRGMEDYLLALQLRTYTDWKETMVDAKVPLFVGVNFDQAKKEKEELETLAWIEGLLKERVARDPKLAERFNVALAEMHAAEVPRETREGGR